MFHHDDIGLESSGPWMKKMSVPKDSWFANAFDYEWKLKRLIKEKHLVPYKLNAFAKQQVSHAYWCGYRKSWYTIMDMDSSKLTVLWEEDKEETEVLRRKLWLNKNLDYELKPAEVWYNPVNTGRSVTYAEIRALCNGGIIKPDISSILKKKYFNNNKFKYSEDTYYFIWSKKGEDGQLLSYIERDIEKSPRKSGMCETKSEDPVDFTPFECPDELFEF